MKLEMPGVFQRRISEGPAVLHSEVMDDPLERMGKTRRPESARIPAGGEAVYVRVSRTEGIVGMTMSPGMGIPEAAGGDSTDRATLVPPDVARKDLAEFE